MWYKRNMASQDLLQSTLKFNNVIPIVASAIMMAISAFSLYTTMSIRLALVEQKQDIIIAQNKEMIDQNRLRLTEIDTKIIANETKLTGLALKVNSLETLQRSGN